MNQKKDFLDELEQTLMLIMIVAATVLTLISFIAQFIAPDSVNLFKQLSFYTYGWMVFLALGPCVKRSAFMRYRASVREVSAGSAERAEDARRDPDVRYDDRYVRTQLSPDCKYSGKRSIQRSSTRHPAGTCLCGSGSRLHAWCDRLHLQVCNFGKGR